MRDGGGGRGYGGGGWGDIRQFEYGECSSISMVFMGWGRVQLRRVVCHPWVFSSIWKSVAHINIVIDYV